MRPAALSRTTPIPGLAVRGYRTGRLVQVDLFWSGSSAGGFDVYRDGRRIATVPASGYTDRLEHTASGCYRYSVRENETGAQSNEAVVILTAAAHGCATVSRGPS